MMKNKLTSYREQSKYWTYQMSGNKKNVWELLEETENKVVLGYRGTMNYSLYSQIDYSGPSHYSVNHTLFQKRYKPLKNDLYDEE